MLTLLTGVAPHQAQIGDDTSNATRAGGPATGASQHRVLAQSTAALNRVSTVVLVYIT
jgi:hypothetical protein